MNNIITQRNVNVANIPFSIIFYAESPKSPACAVGPFSIFRMCCILESRKQSLTEFAMYGASMEPIRAAHEHAPIAAFRTTVGISSAVNMYTIPKAAAAPALPINASTIVSGWRSENLK